MVRCRFDFDRQVAMRLAERMGATPAETLERFRRIVPSTTKPPLPAVAMLGETLVHAEDVRRPLGIRRDCPVEVVTQVAEYYRGSDLVVVAKGRIGGLRLVAQDGPFSTGSGPLVSGPTLALVMAMTGRDPLRRPRRRRCGPPAQPLRKTVTPHRPLSGGPVLRPGAGEPCTDPGPSGAADAQRARHRWPIAF